MPPPSSSTCAPCPSEEVLVGFAAGTLPAPERAGLEHHLAQCGLCFEVVSALAGGTSSGRGTPRDPSAPPPPVLARGTAVGRYLILGPLGAGGMGVVYAAYDPELDRKIALKLLAPHAAHGASSSEGQRLQREARALARLSHPNVVAVYDVGIAAGQVFLAMELVDGQTLGEWLAAGPRTWQQVVRCFTEAGRGLAAAHAGGLVHRDFKPDNVLVGRDGQVRVSDFGLARAVQPMPGEAPAPQEGEASAASALEPGSRPGIQGKSLTGAQAGTPRYMAPEQWLGAETGPWTDQFSFCVVLWEALYGELPFAGTTPEALSREVRTGRVGRAPSRRGVPTSLHAALVRGLQKEPSARHPSMEALLNVLESSPARRRRRVLALLATGALCVALPGVHAAWRSRHPAELCMGGPARVLTVWGSAAREGVRRGLLASGAPAAEPIWEALSRRVDTYTADWAAMHREACEATRMHGEQSDELLGRRMLCLDRALQRVGALARQLEQASPTAAGKAVDAAHALPPLRECADTEALRGAPGLPENEAVRQQVHALRVQLAEVKTQGALGKLKEALPRAEGLTRTAEELPYRPVQAEALLLEGGLRLEAEQYAQARELLSRAVLRAEAGREDTLAVEAWMSLALLEGTYQTAFAEARRSLAHAQAGLERLGRQDPLLSAKLLQVRAGLEDAEGHWAEALALDQERVQLLEEALGPGAPELAGALQNLALSFTRAQGRVEEAYVAIQRSQVLTERHWGTESMQFAKGETALAMIERHRKHYPEARAAYERALAIYARVLGEQSSHYSQALGNLAFLLTSQGEHEAAIAAYQRAVTLERQLAQKDTETLALLLTNQSHAYTEAGRYTEALTAGREALSIRTAMLGPRHLEIGVTLYVLGETLQKQGQHAQALEHFQRAQDILEDTLPADHSYQGICWNAIGHTQLLLGRLAPARASLERALALFQRRSDTAQEQRGTRILLAKVQWEEGGPGRPRARQTLLELREQVEGAARTELDAWLATHPAPP
ncbi:Serine/threonine protein kinase [Stigmatella aurantiaca]|uniref:Serine/threonine protein kinase n=1 Tax=Stigmatella aurantiaca TaxID=41 RepID=A0A1H7XAH8_STIAU|nr:serine/threonine-protein kinase [Stigmatella aurantiaca]SEM30711.1 Serine/threonine protein kinase [Stigmatella aurantiaca]